MLSPAGEGNLTDFCASLFRFQGAAARHCRSRTTAEAVTQGQTEPTLVPETADRSADRSVGAFGASVSIHRRCADETRCTLCGGDGTLGDPRVPVKFYDRFLVRSPAMGRANQKPRKGKPQHLPKVGSKPGLARDGRRDRSAVLDVMGLGNLSSGTKSVIFTGGVILMVVAILALVIWTAFG